MLFRRFAIIILLGSSLLTGCVALLAAGAGAGAVSYIEGVYTQNLDADMPKAYKAALAVVKASNYRLIIQQYDGQKSSITAETKTISEITKSTATIHITVDKLTPKSSKISIRFGTFGDRKSSEALMYKIKQHI